MSIVNTIGNEYEFWNWLERSDNYSNNFSIEGAKALQAYYDELSEDLGENIEFDPIAWCCEFSEYKDFDEFQHDTGYTKDGKQYQGYDNINSLEDLTDHTQVIEFDGGILVREF
jgi:hypothetical protein